jgi:endo-1,4-beta-xylanase
MEIESINFKQKSFIILVFIISLTGILSVYSYTQQLPNSKSKFVGNVIRDGNNIHPIFSKYWNQVTAENAGKWGNVEYIQGSYDWTQLDKIYNYSISNHFPYKHHTLVWGNQQPSFINNLGLEQQYIEIVNWIKFTGERYPEATFCEVVNEPLHNAPSYKNALGGDGATGWDWVIKAFELARQYWSPKTKLLINEYSVINDGSMNARYLEIIKLLKDRNLVDGIGVEGHAFEVDGGASPGALRTNLNLLSATGLPIYISEFEINQQDDSTQLQRYQSIFPLLYEHPGVYGITLWGYIQNEIWRPNAYLFTDRMVSRPALYWLRSYLLRPFPPQIISPNKIFGETRNPLLIWHANDKAESYHLQVSTNIDFSSLVLDTTIIDTLFPLKPLAANTKFYWHVSAINRQGSSNYSLAANFTTGEKISANKKFDAIPIEYNLSQNYPNPFNLIQTRKLKLLK